MNIFNEFDIILASKKKMSSKIIDPPYELRGKYYVWNVTKSHKNTKKHKDINFKAAAEIFHDKRIYEVLGKNSHKRNNDYRYESIGRTFSGEILFVVFRDWIHKETGFLCIRIISARKAEDNEVKDYEEYNEYIKKTE